MLMQINKINFFFIARPAWSQRNRFKCDPELKKKSCGKKIPEVRVNSSGFTNYMMLVYGVILELHVVHSRCCS